MCDARGGAEKIASFWAKNRNVPQIAFAPDWAKHGRAAPFKRNDEMLEIVPEGVMHFPGTGIHDNRAVKAKKLGIPVGSSAARERHPQQLREELVDYKSGGFWVRQC